MVKFQFDPRGKVEDFNYMATEIAVRESMCNHAHESWILFNGRRLNNRTQLRKTGIYNGSLLLLYLRHIPEPGDMSSERQDPHEVAQQMLEMRRQRHAAIITISDLNDGLFDLQVVHGDIRAMSTAIASYWERHRAAGAAHHTVSELQELQHLKSGLDGRVQHLHHSFCDFGHCKAPLSDDENAAIGGPIELQALLKVSSDWKLTVEHDTVGGVRCHLMDNGKFFDKTKIFGSEEAMARFQSTHGSPNCAEAGWKCFCRVSERLAICCLCEPIEIKFLEMQEIDRHTIKTRIYQRSSACFNIG